MVATVMNASEFSFPCLITKDAVRIQGMMTSRLSHPIEYDLIRKLTNQLQPSKIHTYSQTN